MLPLCCFPEARSGGDEPHCGAPDAAKLRAIEELRDPEGDRRTDSGCLPERVDAKASALLADRKRRWSLSKNLKNCSMSLLGRSERYPQRGGLPRTNGRRGSSGRDRV